MGHNPNAIWCEAKGGGSLIEGGLSKGEGGMIVGGEGRVEGPEGKGALGAGGKKAQDKSRRDSMVCLGSGGIGRIESLATSTLGGKIYFAYKVWYKRGIRRNAPTRILKNVSTPLGNLLIL